MSENNESVWAKSIPLKTQIRVITTLMKQAKPFR